MKKTYDLRCLLFEITSRCNAGCEQCGSRCDSTGNDILTKEDIINTLKDIKENIGTDVMINISGGEPLMRKDLFDIMTEVTKLGFDWGMVTNGSLITDDVIEKMRSSGMKTITISLDGVKETHDSLRHIPDGYEKVITALTKLKKAGFLDELQITFTANHKNVYELPQIYDIVSSIGIDSIRVGFMDPIGRAMDNPGLLLTKEEMEFLFWFINKKNKEGKLPIQWGCPHFFAKKADNHSFFCFAGIWAASVLSNGDIFVCPNVDRRTELIQGNIKNDSFSKVWKEGFKYFRDRPLPDECKGCEYEKECAGDSLHTFDFDTQSPRFCYKRIFKKAQHKKYFAFLEQKYGKFEIEEIYDKEDAPAIYLEPAAYEDMRRYFHMGKKHPLSMYEQQMGLVGFRLGKDYVIRYVFPDDGHLRYKDNAIFDQRIIKKAKRETKIIKDNYYFSDDKTDYMGQSGLFFLGFVHSHPIQDELTYSVGDEMIHRRLNKMLKGHYIGILINPADDTIGAYVGEKIQQGRLRIIKQVTT